jgi:hypothetical protein
VRTTLYDRTEYPYQECFNAAQIWKKVSKGEKPRVLYRIKESSCKVCIRGYGAIMSGASLIMQAAYLREMSPNAFFMLHDGSIMLDNDMSKAKKWVTAYEDMGDLVDQFIEVFMGKKGKIKAKLTYSIELDNLGENYIEYINDFITFLNSLTSELDEIDTDLLNIRDEMLAVLNRLKYLLSLK